MSSSRIEEGPTVRLSVAKPLASTGPSTHNQADQRYLPRHAAREPQAMVPEQLVTPQPTYSAVGDTTTRLSAVRVQQAVGVSLPARAHGAALAAEQQPVLSWSQRLLARALRALPRGAK